MPHRRQRRSRMVLVFAITILVLVLLHVVPPIFSVKPATAHEIVGAGDDDDDDQGTISALPSSSTSTPTNVTNSNTTHDYVWRKLDVNETVTRGSHVRLDMTTGERFVKMVPDSPASKTEAENDTTTHHIDQVFTMLSRVDDDPILMGKIEELRAARRADRVEEYKQGVQKLWTERQELLMGYRKDHEEQVKQKRAAEMGAQSNRTEALETTWTISDLLNEARSAADSILSCATNSGDSDCHHRERLYSLLSEIEDQVGDLKVAAEFHKQGGFEKCFEMMRSFPHDERMKVSVSRVFGAAARNHSPFQEHITKSFPGISATFIELMMEERTEHHGLFAFGSLLRGIFDKVAEGDREAAMRVLILKLHASIGEPSDNKRENDRPPPVVDKVSALLGDLAVESGAARDYLRSAFCVEGESQDTRELMKRLKTFSSSSGHVQYLLEQVAGACGGGREGKVD